MEQSVNGLEQGDRTIVKSAPLLSVVTITYNNADGLAQTLRSLNAQEGLQLGLIEHIVVDGASTDVSEDVFRALAPSFSRWSSEPDAGVYDAMNRGMELAHGKYVQFLNAGDTYANRQALIRIMDALRVTEPLWLIGRAWHLNGRRSEPTPIANVPHVWWRHALGLQPHCHQATIFSRPLLCLLGGHSSEFGFVGDFDLILRVGLLAKPTYVDTFVVNYEGGGISWERGLEIPQRLASVRAESMGLGGPLAALNNAWARYRTLRMRIHGRKRLGR